MAVAASSPAAVALLLFPHAARSSPGCRCRLAPLLRCRRGTAALPLGRSTPARPRARPRRHANSLSRRDDAPPEPLQTPPQTTPEKSGYPPLAGKFGIYVHWPYCESKCTYCAFNKYVLPASPQNNRLTAALLSELRHAISERKRDLAVLQPPQEAGSPPKPRVHSVYFGGGTPSLAPPSTIAAVLDLVSAECDVSEDVEVTLEANPTSSQISRLRAFRAAGVTRLSLGIQSFDESALRKLGRDHTAGGGMAAIAESKQVFPGKVTFDLIFGLPGQSLSHWRTQLQLGLDLADNHLSMYQLTIERGTQLYRDIHLHKNTELPDDDVVADMYEETIARSKDAGFEHYEVSSFARSSENRGKHNCGYWMGYDYIGVGPGAHGRISTACGNRHRTYRVMAPKSWMEQCEAEGHGLLKRARLSRREVQEELVVFGLRTSSGIDSRRFTDFGGAPLQEVINQRALAQYVADGLLFWNDEMESLCPSERGMAIMDRLLPRLLDDSKSAQLPDRQ